MVFPHQYDLSFFFRRAVLAWGRAAGKTAITASATNIHELRKVTRRLRTYIWVIPKTKRTKPITDCKMALQELSNQLGSCRMLQVARQDAKSFPFAHASEPSILPILKRRLKHSQKALKASLSNINRTALLTSLHQCCIDLQQVRAKSIFRKLQKAMFQVGEAADHAPKDPEKRHQIRILIKKINIFLDDFGVKNERLGALQKTLGQWHDLVDLESLTRDSSMTDNKELKVQREKLWEKAVMELKKLRRI